MKKVTEEWFNAAEDDLRVIEKIASDEHLTHRVAFHRLLVHSTCCWLRNCRLQ
jgi:hypothetical protein